MEESNWEGGGTGPSTTAGPSGVGFTIVDVPSIVVWPWPATPVGGGAVLPVAAGNDMVSRSIVTIFGSESKKINRNSEARPFMVYRKINHGIEFMAKKRDGEGTLICFDSAGPLMS